MRLVAVPLSSTPSFFRFSFVRACFFEKRLAGVWIIVLIVNSRVVELRLRRGTAGEKMALPMNEADIFEDVDDELAGLTPEDILRRSRLLKNEIRVLKVRNSPHFSLPSLFLIFSPPDPSSSPRI
jgi:hypothetical protein